MTIRDDVKFFFEPPEQSQTAVMRAFDANGVGECSVLYLLRREAQGCMLSRRVPISDDAFLKRIRKKRNCLFAFLMVEFSGIDLLSKFLVGDPHSDVGPRFKKFLIDYGKVSESDADKVYALRNGLMHSFGVFDRGKKGSLGQRIPLEEMCSKKCPDSGSLVFQASGRDTVCLVHCWKIFVDALRSYEDDLIQHVDGTTGILDVKFSRVFPDYGFLRFNPHAIGKGR